MPFFWSIVYNFMAGLCCFMFFETDSLCCLAWPRTHNPSPSASWVWDCRNVPPHLTTWPILYDDILELDGGWIQIDTLIYIYTYLWIFIYMDGYIIFHILLYKAITTVLHHFYVSRSLLRTQWLALSIFTFFRSMLSPR
jgi:hypothetical protein